MIPIEGPTVPLAQPHAAYEPAGGLSIGEGRGGGALKLERASGIDSFSEVLKGAVMRTNDAIVAAQQVSEEFAAGRRDDIHGTMLSLTKADIELRTLGNVRNKIVDAFYELWRMQV